MAVMGRADENTAESEIIGGAGKRRGYVVGATVKMLVER